jgi:Flp pilus assembly protein TadD
MRTQRFRKTFAGCLVLAAFVLSAHAKQQTQQGGGQQTPPPQPSPQPQPQPRPTNIPVAPQPTPANQPTVNIHGRIIAGPRGGPDIMEIKIETDGGQPIGFAYADSTGDFHFTKTGVTVDRDLYVVVNLDGFKPHRERVFGGFGNDQFEAFVTIFLEPETPEKQPSSGGPIVDLKQLRAKVPSKAVDEYEKAMKEAAKGNRAKAVEGLQRAIKLAPDFYEAQHTLGVQFIALQKFDDAETALIRARDLSPKAPEPLINLGSLYYERGQTQADEGHAEDAQVSFKKALEFLEESVRRNPLSASANGFLGAALYKTGSMERAETSLNKALELDEHDQNARLMLINVYTKTGRYKEALGQTNLFLEKNPKSPQRSAMENIKQQIERALNK